MIRTSFNDGWEYRPKVNPFAELIGPTAPYQPVTLPHDAMIARDRVSSADGAGAYFPGGAVEYRKRFHPPADWRGKRIMLEFDGIYRDATIHINGSHAGHRPYGYSRFRVDADPFLRFGADNEIRVEARTHQDSRWYTGAGIYRDTWLLVGGLVRIAPDGVRVTTPDVDPERAVVEVATTVVNDSIEIRTVGLVTELRGPTGAIVAADPSILTVLPGTSATARQRLYPRQPALWSVDTPDLHQATVRLTDPDGGSDLDTESVRFGIRSLRLDPDHGLRINGETVTLRGSCLHHDNGVIGAVSTAAAELRRVRLLKDAGFNALRMAHHPMSPAMLDACDHVGMLVLDEAFDMWTQTKSDFDYSLSFPEWWERDIEAMVAKDANHPSVIMYSIGNEIPETGSPTGAALGRAIAERLRTLDPTRFVTNGINTMLAVLSDLPAIQAQLGSGSTEDRAEAGINTQMMDVGEAMGQIAASELVTRRTAESFGLLDVAGMNYAASRYEIDRGLFPNRIILGTESFPTRIDRDWDLVTRNSHVIGDFTWTGWDYLGEVGIGRAQYLTEDNPRPSAVAPYPHLVAGCGDIDITGHPRPVSHYRQIVFGLRHRPCLAVRPPQHHGQVTASTPWAWSDAEASWTWPGYEGHPVTVEVYAAADEVELLVNDHSVGRARIERFRASLDTVYQPGHLVAVAYRDGVEVGRDALLTAADPVVLRAEAERSTISATGGDLAFVALSLTDPAGVVHPAADRPVTLEVTGAGVVLGFGSANPSTEERFDAATHHTHRGRALAVLRPTGEGTIRLVATAPGCPPAEVSVQVRPHDG